MRAVMQRVRWARVSVADEVVGEIGPGLCALIGVARGDTGAAAVKLAEKVWGLRVFDDEAGVMNRSAADVGGEVLVVSQFTLYGDARKGRRPTWNAAAPSEVAEPIYDEFCHTLRTLGVTVAEGVFGAHMEIALTNDGPTTLVLDF
jgi:D-aminoacyl-tRNA deacylase